MKISLKHLPRGEHSGKGFFISTFRFDLPLAQALEKLALSKGLSMSSVINQVLQQFVDSVEIPDNIKPVKTAKPTVWGDQPEKPAKKPAKKAKVAVEEDEEDEAPAPKKKAKKLVKKATTKKVVVEEDEEEEDEEEAPKKKAKKAKKATSVLSKLKKKKVSVDDEMPEDD